MTIYRPELLGVVESPLVQIATAAEAIPGALKLCYGESDTPTPDFIIRAAHEAALAGHTFYTHTAGYPELREAIAAKIHELHGVTYKTSEIMATVGGTLAIYAAIRACIGPGDNAVLISPAYAIYRNAVIMMGGEPRSVALSHDDDAGFSLDIDRVRRRMDGKTTMIIVNSPSNPTGWMITTDEQRALYQLAQRMDVTLLADEVYERLAFDGEVAPSFARIVEDHDRLVVVNSFSKTYNMTGWRLGWVQSNEAMTRLMYSGAEFVTSNPTAMVQQAGIVALRDGEAYVREQRAQNAKRRAMVVEALGSLPRVSLPDPKGAFYAFPRIHRLDDSAAFTAELLRKTGVALAPGIAFGAEGEGYVRLCFAASDTTLSMALDRFAHFIASQPTRAM